MVSTDDDTIAQPLDGPVVDPLARERLKAEMFPSIAGPPKVGRFTISGELGRGGMGVVYAGFDPELHRPVAVKVLGAKSGSEAMHQRLRTEARAMAQLSHPNVVQVHEVGVHEEQVYIAMEFVEGEDLGAWLDAVRPRLWQLLDVFIAAGDGLAAAHAKGLVHRDFKPANVMVTTGRGPNAQPRVRVMDFGLARSEAITTSPASVLETTLRAEGLAVGGGHTRDGDLVGTPVYMSPEQLRGQAVTAKSDQFAFCVALFEALYGVRPFGGETLADLSAHVLTGKRVEVDPSGLPDWLHAVVQRGLSPDPKVRWESMQDVLDELRGGRVHKGLGAGTLVRPSGGSPLALAGAGVGGVLGGIGAWAGYRFGGSAAHSDGLIPLDTVMWVGVMWSWGTVLAFAYIYWGLLRRGRLDRLGDLAQLQTFESSVPRARALELLSRASGEHGYVIDDQRWDEGELCIRVRGSTLSMGAFIRVRIGAGDPTSVDLALRPVTWGRLDWFWKAQVPPVVEGIRSLLGDGRRYPPRSSDASGDPGASGEPGAS